MQLHPSHVDPEQGQGGSGLWKSALCIAAATAAIPIVLYSGFEVGAEAAERATAERSRARSAWMAENWGPRWSEVEREVRSRDGGAERLAQPVKEVDAPSWQSVSADLRGAVVEELLASRERICEGFVGDRSSVAEKVLAILGEPACFAYSAAEVLVLAGLAQTFEEQVARAASNAFDLVLELDDALWAQTEYDKGLFHLPQRPSVIDLAPKTGVAFTRAKACGPWLVRYSVDCAEDPRIEEAQRRIRALQLERDEAMRAAAEEWRTP